MNQLKELREKRAKLFAEADEILRRARSAARDLTKEERERFDKLHDEIDELGAEIRRIERHEDAGRELNTSRGVIAGRQDMRGDVIPGFGGDALNDAREVRALRDDESVRDYLEARGELDGAHEMRGVTFARYVRAMVLGPQNDAERRALAEGTDSAGGYTVPAVLSSVLIDRLRTQTHVLRAGARMVPLASDQHAFARIASDPVPAWRGEGQQVTEGEPTFERILFKPKSLAFLVKASRELLEDNAVNLESALPQIFARAFAAELDRVALFGSGQDNEPVGIATALDAAGVNTVTLGTGNGGELADYGPILDVRQLILEGNAPEPTDAIMSPRTGRVVAGFADATGQPLRRPPALEQMTFRETTQVPNDEVVGTATNASRIIIGGFRSLWIGVRTEMRVEVLRERYADTLQYGFLCWARYDVNFEHLAPFGQVKGIIPGT